MMSDTELDAAVAPLSSEQEAIVERMGRNFEAEGVPRIGGRLYGFLLLQTEPCSLDDLAGGLKVSKTSVSSNARLLEGTRLIERVTKPGDRRDYYRAAPDQTRTLEFRLQRVREMGQLLTDALDVVADGDPIVRSRFALMEEFNGEALDVLTALLESWRCREREQ